MPRKIVPLLTGETYHIYNRGVDKRTIFLDNEDYLRLYSSLKFFNDTNPVESLYICTQKFRNGGLSPKKNDLVQINAYCLIPNHYHLIVTQVSDGGISEFMKRIGCGYTSYFNEKYARSGSLFQGTYKRVPIVSNEQLLSLTAYVNYNHIVHNITNANEIFKSSKNIYAGRTKNNFIYPDLILKQFSSPEAYEKDAVAHVMKIRDDRNKDPEGVKSSFLEQLS